MSTALAVKEESGVATNWMFDSDAVSQIQRVAKMFCSSTLVPKDYQGEKGLANCVIALNMAYRMKADPLMVMQNLYVVHGRPSWSSQFMIACFNQTGRFSPIRYVWSGTEGKDDWGCQAWSTDRETKERIEGPTITIEMAKKEGWVGKSGSKWQTIPKLMLMYRAASWMVRTHAPELTMGLQTQEEAEDIAPPPPVSLGHNRASQVEGLLSGSDSGVIDAEVAALSSTLSPFAPTESENAVQYVGRLKKELSIAGSADAVNDIVNVATGYVGGIITEDDLGSLADAANQRMQQLTEAKKSGKLV